jgi:hypothetical protein
MTKTLFLKAFNQTLPLPTVINKLIYDYAFLTLEEFRKFFSSGEKNYSHIHFEESCDFTGLDLRGFIFTYASLPKATFGSSNFSYFCTRINFKHADLIGSTFKKISLLDTHFDQANLTNAFFTECNLHDDRDLADGELFQPTSFHQSIIEKAVFFDIAWKTEWYIEDLGLYGMFNQRDARDDYRFHTSKGKNIIWIWSSSSTGKWDECPPTLENRLSTTQNILSLLESDKFKTQFAMVERSMLIDNINNMDLFTPMETIGTKPLFLTKRKNADSPEENEELILNKYKKPKV